ncbi:MAG: hypothetical protein EA359_18435 [Balneolaceae bacterium]|nr:MAG: hypothetical protein EA359_18435 [Balneolaceae bacterium]
MKKIIKAGILPLLTILIFTDAQAQVSAGGGILYGFDIERIGIRVDGLYAINDDWRAAADFGYYFPESEFGIKVSWWELNLNAHYVFVDNEDFRAYALAGINYISFSVTEDNNSSGLIPGSDFFARTAAKEINLESETPPMPMNVDSFFSSFSYSGSETGLNIGIGGEYKVGFGSVFAELKFAGLGGNADQLVLGAGLRYDF